MHRKIHFPAGYPLTLGSQNARRAISSLRCIRGGTHKKNPLHTDVEGTHISHRSWGFLRQVILLEIDISPGDPLLNFFVLEGLVNMHDDGVGILLAKQELVDEGLYLRILALGELAVSVTALD